MSNDTPRGYGGAPGTSDVNGPSDDRESRNNATRMEEDSQRPMNRSREGANTIAAHHNNNHGCSSETRWSKLETGGMREAKCSLLLQEEVEYDAKIKALQQQQVRVYQDRGLNHSPSPNAVTATAEEDSNTTSFDVDFAGATILQLEPVIGGPQKTMPVTITIGGRCIFTPENYQDFLVMMRTKEQSQEMDIAPNGNFDWPDVSSLLLCPVCGCTAPIPRAGDRIDHEYWMVFYPLLQITVMQGSQMTLGTRTICRLTCLDCMDDMLFGLKLEIQPGGSNRRKLCFTLPASDVLAEAGSASFLEDGPPRPDTHPHVDDILDAWTLYNLWEHSGAWEALQNDYRSVLSRSMNADPSEAEQQQESGEARLKDRLGQPCGNPSCNKVWGERDPETGAITKLLVKCRECKQEYYCSDECRELAKEHHREACLRIQRERHERRDRRARRVQCDACQRRFPFTKMKKCSRCRNATYCSVDCQRLDWQRHRDVCC